VGDGVPRGLVGLLVSAAAGAAVGWLGRGGDGGLSASASLVLGGVLGAVAALAALVASFVVVEAGEEDDGGPRRSALAVVQTALPLAACAPVAHVLLMAL